MRAKKRGSGLAMPQRLGDADELALLEQVAHQRLDARGLVGGDPDAQPGAAQALQRRPRVGVQVIERGRIVGDARGGPGRDLAAQVEAGPQQLEGAAVIGAALDRRAERGGQLARLDAEPARPRRPRPLLGEERVPDVEDDGLQRHQDPTRSTFSAWMRFCSPMRRASGSGAAAPGSSSSASR